MFGHLETARRTARACLSAPLCGACHAMSGSHRQRARVLVGADASVLLALLDGLRNEPLPRVEVRCPLPPWRRKSAIDPTSDAARFVAEVVVLLAGAKLRDDRDDADHVGTRLAARWLHADVVAATEALRRRGLPVEGWLATLASQSAVERNPSVGLDGLAEPTATALEAIARAGGCVAGCDHLDALGAFAGQLGRCIYLVDGLVDLRRDVARGTFNPIARALGALSPASVAWLRRVVEGRFAELETRLEALGLRRHGAALRAVTLEGLRALAMAGLDALPAPPASLPPAGWARNDLGARA